MSFWRQLKLGDFDKLDVLFSCKICRRSPPTVPSVRSMMNNSTKHTELLSHQADFQTKMFVHIWEIALFVFTYFKPRPVYIYTCRPPRYTLKWFMRTFKLNSYNKWDLSRLSTSFLHRRLIDYYQRAVIWEENVFFDRSCEEFAVTALIIFLATV